MNKSLTQNISKEIKLQNLFFETDDTASLANNSYFKTFMKETDFVSQNLNLSKTQHCNSNQNERFFQINLTLDTG